MPGAASVPPALPTDEPEWARSRILPPLLFIVFALLALLLVPLRVDQQANAMRRRSAQSIGEARSQLDAVETQLALMSASTRGYVLTGDEQFRQDYRSADAVRDRAFSALIPRARAVSPEILEHVIALRALFDEWQVVPDALVHSDLSRDAYLEHLPRQQAQFQQLLASIARVEDAVDREADRDAAEIQRVEWMGMLGTAVLTALVILATLLLFLLARRFRHLATQNAQLAAAADQGREEVERMMASRGELIRGVHHDLQNPIGAAGIYLDLLATEVTGTLAAEQRVFVASARRGITSASAILTDLLDLSRSEAGLLRIEPLPTDVRALILDWLEDVRSAARVAGLELETEVAEELPIVGTDAPRVRRILDNLLSNAIKYTPAGGRIRVSAGHVSGFSSRATTPGLESAVVVEVADNGPGIAPEALEHLFQEFYRAPGARGPGTGVGLAISRKFARLLGGELSVESEAGVGSTFTLSLPDRGPSAREAR